MFSQDYSGALAYIHDWLVVRGGAERLLEAALEITPKAEVFTSVYRPEVFSDSIISQHPIHPSFIDRLPFAHRYHNRYLPLMPLAVEQHDLTAFPLLVSISYAVAHGVVPRPDQRHISYILSPARYAWHLYHDYLHDSGLKRGPRSWMARLALHYLRLWDVAAAQRVDHYVAISHWVADCVWRAYRRPTEVIYPPVDIDRFEPKAKREDFYLTVARFAPYKKIPLIVEAFTRCGYPLIVVGNGPDFKKAAALAGANVQLLGAQPDALVADLMSRARGFVYMAEEDFGIALVEAQAAACPVIAFGRGGARETVIEGRTGLFVPQQSVDSLIETLQQFEAGALKTDPGDLRSNAERFSKARFQREFTELLARQAELT